jgi:hypothetical protein
MKKYLLLLWLLMPAAASAMSCPNNSSIIEKGDSIQEVVNRCGEPLGLNNYAHTVPVKNEWAYRDGDVIYKHAVTSFNETRVIELAYSGSRLSPSTLRFEDGKLVSWE